jgi:hypothetical protein
MAYTNGVFYIDLVNGSDAARTALTTCIASNPSGTITRINKTAHGLVTGAVVDLTLFSAWLNAAWKITKVDNDNFDLDDAVWQTTADNSGTVTPRGGSSWSDAWKTVTSGATAARTQSGDEIKVSKTDDPVSIGNATWTNKSKTVTLSTPQTITVDNCESGWVAQNGQGLSYPTSGFSLRQGSAYLQAVRTTAYSTNTLYAYKTLPGPVASVSVAGGGSGYTIGTQIRINSGNNNAVVQVTGLSGTAVSSVVLIQPGTGYSAGTYSTTIISGSGTGCTITVSSVSATDFSAYDSLTFWATGYYFAIAANSWKLALCSDTAGTVIEYEYPIQATLRAGGVCSFVSLGVSVGGNKSAIRSVALYSSTVAPRSLGGGAGITLDNISACNSNGLNLKTLISKKSAATFDTSEGWYGIQNIDGTTIRLDSYIDSLGKIATYSGTTQTTLTYMRKTFQQLSTNQTTGVNALNNNGLSISGGWNTSTNTKDGMTVLDGVDGYSYGLSMKPGCFISDFWFCRWSFSLFFYNSGQYYTIQNCGFSNSSEGVTFYPATAIDVKILSCMFVGCKNATMLYSGGGSIRPLIKDSKYLSNTDSSTMQGDLINCDFLQHYDVTTNGDVRIFDNIGPRKIVNCTFSRVEYYVGPRSLINLKNCLITGSTEFSGPSGFDSRTDYYLFSEQHDRTPYNFVVSEGGTMVTMATDRPGQTGNMWRMSITSNVRTSYYPLRLSLMKIAVTANNLVTIKAWMKKSHATNCNGKLRVKGYQIEGVKDDVISTMTNTVDWQEVTLTFTPTENGVVEVEALAEYVAANANIFIDTVTVTQA